MKREPGTLFLLVGPSQVGKDSILRGILRRRSLGLRKAVTVTTRERRTREVPGRTYHYVTDAEFKRRMKNGDFLEWAPVRNYRFGTPKEPLLTWLRQGKNIVQQIDVRGAAALRNVSGLTTVTIFILPGSIRELRERLAAKAFTPAQRKIRWRETTAELARQSEFDFRVVNAAGKLAEAIDDVAGIVAACLKHGAR